MPHEGVARCVTSTLPRTDGLWVTVCLTCPTRRGYNARGRTYVSEREARMSGKDHGRAKVRHRIKVQALHDWHLSLAVAETWQAWIDAAHTRHPGIYEGDDNGTWQGVREHIRADLDKRGVQWRS
jgi:hypothetical protein